VILTFHAVASLCHADKQMKRSTRLIWPERHLSLLVLMLAIFTAIAFAGWVFYTESMIRTPNVGTVDIISATFGENCGARKDNDRVVI
jgi:hypothetical protein